MLSLEGGVSERENHRWTPLEKKKEGVAADEPCRRGVALGSSLSLEIRPIPCYGHWGG